MYFIMKGEVRVVTSTGVTLATLGKYKHFGEMALIQETASVRSTSIIANTNVQAALLTRRDFKLICEQYPEFKTRMQEIIDQRAKDSIKKGVNISNSSQQKVENKELSRFVTMINIDQMKISSQAISAQNTNANRQGVIEKVTNLQLSMIEEESRKDQSVIDTISRSHSFNESVKRISKKMRESGSGSLDIGFSQGRRESSSKRDGAENNLQAS